MINGMFTDRVKKVMQIAREESVRLGNDYVGTDICCLGLIKEGDGVAVAVLRGMNIDLEELSATIEKGGYIYGRYDDYRPDAAIYTACEKKCLKLLLRGTFHVT